mmetsp:Transcript_22725/g.38662  ORF Transcript_22725/g.38662 Transcript_22725/m.38662 type:complete len:333 (+) Transcript_22725:3-1001(+)
MKAEETAALVDEAEDQVIVEDAEREVTSVVAETETTIVVEEVAAIFIMVAEAEEEDAVTSVEVADVIFVEVDVMDEDATTVEETIPDADACLATVEKEMTMTTTKSMISSVQRIEVGEVVVMEEEEVDTVIEVVGGTTGEVITTKNDSEGVNLAEAGDGEVTLTKDRELMRANLTNMVQNQPTMETEWNRTVPTTTNNPKTDTGMEAAVERSGILITITREVMAMDEAEEGDGADVATEVEEEAADSTEGDFKNRKVRPTNQKNPSQRKATKVAKRKVVRATTTLKKQLLDTPLQLSLHRSAEDTMEVVGVDEDADDSIEVDTGVVVTTTPI